MSSTFREMAETLHLSKPTVIKAARALDPERAHIKKDEKTRTEIMDDYLSSAVADYFTKKNMITGEMPQIAGEPQTIREASESNREPRIKGVKSVVFHESDAMKEVYERLLESEAANHKILLDSKQDEIDRLRTELEEANRKIQGLEEKVEAERARYDELSSQTIKALSVPKQPWWRRLLGKPKE